MRVLDRTSFAAPVERRLNAATVIWVAFCVGALVLLDALDLTVWGVAVPIGALLLSYIMQPRRAEASSASRAAAALGPMVVMYLVVVGLFRLAFRGFTTDRVAGLFLCFAAGLIVGVVGPLIVVVWRRGGCLADLGLGSGAVRRALPLAVVFGGVQFAMTLWGYDYPAAKDWVPLLAMSLVVGMFEAVFFRGFIQNQCEAAFGTRWGIALAASMYALYHVGYGMGAGDMVFLLGLGVVYAIIFRLGDHLLVLWPLLTPMGALFNNLESGDIELPWASIAGFADIAVVMVVVVLLTRRHERRRSERLAG